MGYPLATLQHQLTPKQRYTLIAATRELKGRRKSSETKSTGKTGTGNISGAKRGRKDTGTHVRSMIEARRRQRQGG